MDHGDFKMPDSYYDQPEGEDFDFDKRYSVHGYDYSVAWRALSYETWRDEDYEWTGIENENYDRVVCVMVGDDRKFTFDVEDMIPIEDNAYCHECGQIGCGWHTGEEE